MHLETTKVSRNATWFLLEPFRPVPRSTFISLSLVLSILAGSCIKTSEQSSVGTHSLSLLVPRLVFVKGQRLQRTILERNFAS